MKNLAPLSGLFLLALYPFSALGQAVQVADLNTVGAGSYPKNIVRAGSNTFFTADDGIHGVELWVLPDGESARLVKDIAPGPYPSYPSENSGRS